MHLYDYFVHAFLQEYWFKMQNAFANLNTNLLKKLYKILSLLLSRVYNINSLSETLVLKQNNQ